MCVTDNSDVRQSIDELLKVKKCDFIIGNHDTWALDWALRGDKPEIWTSQGGRNTIRSYYGGPMPKEHIDFLKSGQLWLELGNQIFVHGCFDPDVLLSKSSARHWFGTVSFLILPGSPFASTFRKRRPDSLFCDAETSGDISDIHAKLK